MMQDKLVELLDKQAIMEVIYKYAEGIDRRDPELLSSIFTPDAMLHYGKGLFDGPARDLIARWGPGQPSRFLHTHHQVGNILIEFQAADRATAVTYLTAVHRALRDGRRVDENLRARYLDKLIKQGDTWRIAQRDLVYDWSHIGPADETSWWEQPGAAAVTGAHGATDLSGAYLTRNRLPKS
jgi:hypothetical protein